MKELEMKSIELQFGTEFSVPGVDRGISIAAFLFSHWYKPIIYV